MNTPNNNNVERAVAAFQNTIDSLRQRIGEFIVGQKEVIDGVIICLIADGQVLLEGVPGLGKTMLVRTLAEAISCNFQRVQFTPDMMPSDIIGTQMIVEDENGSKHFTFQKGPVFTNILLADEINRATPKTQSALLEAMQEKSVTVGNQSHQLPPPFFVMATQNPLEMEGTYPLPEAQLDRFLFKIDVPFPSKDDLREILARTTGQQNNKIEPVITGDDVIKLREIARQVPIAQHLTDYALDLVLATHPEHENAIKIIKQYVRFGSSPRGAQAIIKTAKIRALFDGRFNVAYQDIVASAKPTLRHRTILNFEGAAEGISSDEIIDEIIRAIPQK